MVVMNGRKTFARMRLSEAETRDKSASEKEKEIRGGWREEEEKSRDKKTRIFIKSTSSSNLNSTVCGMRRQVLKKTQCVRSSMR